MCKRSARPNGEVYEEIDMRSMHVGTDEYNGVRVCVCDPIMCVQRAITAMKPKLQAYGYAW